MRKSPRFIGEGGDEYTKYFRTDKNERDTQWGTGSRCLADEILQRDDEMTYLITTENLSTLMGIQGEIDEFCLRLIIFPVFGLSN